MNASLMQPVMNNTRWRELQTAMIELKSVQTLWRTRCLENGFISAWDGEWFYHFSQGGYTDIEWVEIKVEGESEREIVLSRLKKIHVPGEVTEHGFKVFGYIPAGQTVDYL
ncbi:hypothetical protein CA11_54080 [Gimesia maris]|uniref:DUF6678 family protein n=1 Tax=Gimesia maris TaxID=122 RepID=UPI0011896912|nr:DUF6678 family protein [Gimesia maris]QDT81811.1 hypothetical protein Mal35_52960 [Gimesia maris]QDU17565.1 hypothetical protein CA11_54080 [Gimesia maris]|tara:strand:+ start:471 stop:803 length:333 start_codon:yes stop_codon:yes gene_type:complete